MKKTFLGILIFGFVSISFANEIETKNIEDTKNIETKAIVINEEIKNENIDLLEETKEKIKTKIDERIMILENVKECVSNSTTKEDLDNCKPDKKQENKTEITQN